jgi:hypothetical protein
MRRLFIVLVTIWLVSGCGPRLLYPNLDWLIPWYFDDYISLDASQSDRLNTRLADQIHWHCRTQLRPYAAWLRELGRDVEEPRDDIELRRKLERHWYTLQGFWKALMGQISPDAADLLQTLSDEQIAELFENLATKNRALRKKYVDIPPAQADAARRRRMTRRLENWIGPLTAAEKSAVAQWSRELTPSAEQWLANRMALQDRLRRLLARRSETGRFQRELHELLVVPETFQSPAYRNASAANTSVTIDLMVRLEHLLTPEQRTRLLRKIRSMASDFDDLSC